MPSCLGSTIFPDVKKIPPGCKKGSISKPSAVVIRKEQASGKDCTFILEYSEYTDG